MTDIIAYDALIVVTPADFVRVKVNYDRLFDLLPVRKIIFIGSDEVCHMAVELPYGDKVSWINENDIVNFDEVHSLLEKRLEPVLNGEKLPRRVTGWYYQQFLKMQYAYICPDEYYMVWDGDTVPCKKFSMFSAEAKPYLDLKHEEHEEYFVTLSKILPGMGKVIGPSFISEHMLMNKAIMTDMLKDIESNPNIDGDKYWEKILNAIPTEKLQSNSFSEFETYGTYVALRHQNAYKLRDWHSFRYGSEFFVPETMKDSDFEWLGRDFFAISFEKNQSVRPDHANLFDNPEYQSKLSARQMLQVVQEVMSEGYEEKWDKIGGN